MACARSQCAETFTNRSLSALLRNEATFGHYLGRRVSVKANHPDSDSANFYCFNGDISCIDTSGLVTFLNIDCRTHFLREGSLEEHEVHCSQIQGISLVLSTSSSSPTAARASRPNPGTFRALLLDHCRLKMVRFALYELSRRSDLNCIGPLAPNRRNRYRHSSTTTATKQQIGREILNLKVPDDDDSFLRALCAVIRHSFSCREPSSRDLPYFSLVDAVSLIHDFHGLWKQHILDAVSMPRTEFVPSANSNFVDWDELKIRCLAKEIAERKKREFSRRDELKKRRRESLSIGRGVEWWGNEDILDDDAKSMTMHSPIPYDILFENIDSIESTEMAEERSTRSQRTPIDAETMEKRTMGLLNRITPENFDKLAFQILLIAEGSVPGDGSKPSDEGRFAAVITSILDKAARDSMFSAQYAALCLFLGKHFEPRYDDMLAFDKMLVGLCERQFSSQWTDVSENVADPELLGRRRDTLFGTVLIIGELFNRKLLPSELITEGIINAILSEGPRRRRAIGIETVCKLLGICGQNMDRETVSKYVDAMSASAEHFGFRTRVLVETVEEMMANGGRHRIAKERPRTLEEVRTEFVEETRGPVIQRQE